MISLKLYNTSSTVNSLNKTIDFPFRSVLSEEIEKVSTDFKNIVIAGIGGSDLGTKAIFNALLHPYNNEINDRKIYFAGDTTDPDQINALFDVIIDDNTLFILVSKSGETIELKMYLEVLKRKYSDISKLKDHLWMITDPKTGAFREFADENELSTFDIPEHIGGRFSVLTNVGLIPANLFNIDTSEMIRGAKDLDEYFFRTENDFVSEYVNSILNEYRNGKNISVMMPYKYGLKEFAKWYQQLWAESLGKDDQGQTPVAMMGPNDQHSQLQLMLDGPNDKFTTIIQVDKARSGRLIADYPVEGHNFSFENLLNLEAAATIEALSEKEKPVAVLEIPELTPYYLGQLFYFFELAVVLFADAIQVNAFDQPAVEVVKQKINQKTASI